MIVDKETKEFQTRSDRPSTNWTERDFYVVDEATPEGAALAAKIIKNFPYYEFVLDNTGSLVNITPTERPPEPPLEPSELDLLLMQVKEQQKIIDALMGGETNG